jgi:hypothetical protein
MKHNECRCSDNDAEAEPAPVRWYRQVSPVLWVQQYPEAWVRPYQYNTTFVRCYSSNVTTAVSEGS